MADQRAGSPGDERDDVEPTHVHCIECDSYTEIEEGNDEDDTPCLACENNGADDPYCVEPVAIIDCPNGVTAADWQPGGYKDGKNCDDDFHEPRTGKHVVEIPR